MEKIKVISNPYKGEVLYQRWNNSIEQWANINYENNGNSKLVSNELTKCFLPFKAKEIVDVIIKEYISSDKKISLVFEGTDDEFKELYSICSDEKYNKIIELTKSENYIQNARDILPDIVEVFEELRTLISRSVRDEDKVKREIDKFIEAASSIIPICVLGTYSSGKSTFINALVGSEILPSSDQPLTAKIYKIKKTEQSDRAAINFEYDEKKISLKFHDNVLVEDKALLLNELYKKIIEEIKNIRPQTLQEAINKTLEIINSYEDDRLSDLIEIEIPFKSGILASSQKNYVIFDTPGSNSESNEKHLVVLKKAMQDLSNGLPIYISGYESLDTKDNADLYKVIKSMKELDSRFTMIIVNKADTARLPKEGFSSEYEHKVLSQAVPKKMYSDGMYFVSSIMGLGSKNEGDFIDDYYSEIYETQKHNYVDENSKFHKELYKYDIVAEQMKQKLTEQSEKCSNPIYANSGLFSVEKEIERFAIKYSSYNKCQQAKLFLDNIIQITSDEIDQTKEACEDIKVTLGQTLEKEKKELIEKLEDRKNELENEYIKGYPDVRKDALDLGLIVTTDELNDLQSQIEKAQQINNNFDEHLSRVKESQDSIADNFKENIKNVFKSPSMDKFKDVSKELASNIKENQENKNTLNNVKKDIDRATADELLKKVSDKFDGSTAKIKNYIDDKSKIYWSKKTDEIKDELIKIVTNSTSLTEQEKSELSQIIITYRDLNLENHTNDIFEKKHFVYGIKFFKFEIGGVDKLNIDKIKRKYNSNLKESADAAHELIHSSHEDSFKSWLQCLLEKVKENIIDFNPSLRNLARTINEKTQQINELQERQNTINEDREKINSMMEWRLSNNS